MEGGASLGKATAIDRRVQDETSSEEELTFASQTGTPTAKRDQGDAEESGTEKETDDSDVGDKEAVENEADYEDYLAAQIFRTDLERWIAEPHFEDSVLGCFVRLHGADTGGIENRRNEYLMAEVTGCQMKEDIQPYKFGPLKKLTRVQLRLKRASNEFWMGLKFISNSEITEKEFQDWVQVCKKHKRPLPSKEDMEDRKEQIDQARKFVFTHVEVKKILDAKRKQGSLKVSNGMQRAHFMRLRDYYRDQKNAEKVKELDAKIKELETKAESKRKALSLGVMDKSAVAREKKLKAEALEAAIEHRRPRVLEKFEKKLERLPPHRRPKALLAFYGSYHPICANIQESDVKRPFLERSPSPDTQPPLPKSIVLEPDLDRDLNHASLTGDAQEWRSALKRLADEAPSGNALICQQMLRRWESGHSDARHPKKIRTSIEHE